MACGMFSQVIGNEKCTALVTMLSSTALMFALPSGTLGTPAILRSRWTNTAMTNARTAAVAAASVDR